MSVRNRIQSSRRIRITLNCGVVTPASLLIKTTIIAKQQHSPSGCLAVLSYVSIMTCDLSPVSQLIGWRFSLVESFCPDFKLRSISAVAALRVFYTF